MGWIKDRIDAEYRKHKNLDWARLAEYKIIGSLKESETPYAYLCPLCCTILECPCFVGKVCPECGCDKPDILYLKINGDNK